MSIGIFKKKRRLSRFDGLVMSINFSDILFFKRKTPSTVRGNDSETEFYPGKGIRRSEQSIQRGGAFRVFGGGAGSSKAEEENTHQGFSS